MPRQPWYCRPKVQRARTPSDSCVRSKCTCMPMGLSGPHAKQFPSSNGTSFVVTIALASQRQSFRKVGGQTGRAHLARHLIDCVAVADPFDAPPLRIEEHERWIGVEVARLTDAAHVDDVAFSGFEHELAAMLHVLVTDGAVLVARPVLRDVGVADEDERRVGAFERRRRGRFIENIIEIPDGRAVNEQEVGEAKLVRERVEPRAARLVEYALSPDDGRARDAVEAIDAEVLERGEIVIAQHRVPATIAQNRHALVGIGSVAHDVTERNEGIGRLCCRERPLERFEIGVNVRHDRIFHGPTTTCSKTACNACAKVCRIGSVPALTRIYESSGGMPGLRTQTPRTSSSFITRVARCALSMPMQTKLARDSMQGAPSSRARS